MESLLGSSIVSRAVPFSGIQEVAEVKSSVVKAKCQQQQQQQQTAGSSLPLLRSSFPGPLRFLWFTKQGEAEKIQDPFSVASNDRDQSQSEQEEIAASAIAADEVKSYWGLSNWGIRSISLWSSSSSSSNNNNELIISEVEEEAKMDSQVVEQEEEESSTTTTRLRNKEVCSECEFDGDEHGCCVGEDEDEPSSPALELPHVQVGHDRESFARFLQPMTLAESRATARLSHLCNLAYKIQDIKASDLLTHHNLTLVTSSLVKKVEALEAASSSSKQPDSKNSIGKEADTSSRFTVSPASAYALASAVASYLHSHAKSLLRLRQRNDLLQKQKQEEDSTEDPDPAEDLRNHGADEMATFIASSPVTAVVAAKDGTKDAVAKDLQSLHNCPCEWYCCDDDQHFTRYFVIQGSESLASWQANLLFEPTHFEDSSLGVMVHRGIYEAAKGLYEQLLPCVVEHLQKHGEKARFRFTGHSLGGSLATLVSLMLQIRGVVPREALLPVLTLGSPCIMCGGDYLLEKLGLPADHVRSLILHRDIVPRTFACNYPDHVAEILKRLNGSFRDHPCLNNQRLLYAPMGQFVILQPSESDAPPHPLLPPGLGIYILRHPEVEEEGTSGSSRLRVELRAAQRAFLNCPHPLETLSDPGSYGSEGSISRDHDPRSYMRTVMKVAREEAKKSRRLRRQQRRGLWWPLMTAELSSMFVEAGEGEREMQQRAVGAAGGEDAARPFRRWKSLVGAQQQSQVLVLFFLSAKLMVMQGFAAFFAWA